MFALRAGRGGWEERQSALRTARENPQLKQLLQPSSLPKSTSLHRQQKRREWMLDHTHKHTHTHTHTHCLLCVGPTAATAAATHHTLPPAVCIWLQRCITHMDMDHHTHT